MPLDFIRDGWVAKYQGVMGLMVGAYINNQTMRLMSMAQASGKGGRHMVYTYTEAYMRKEWPFPFREGPFRNNKGMHPS